MWADLGQGSAPDGICVDAEGAIWYATVPGQHCVRVAEGGEVLETVEVDRGCFACMLGGDDGRTLFVVANHYGAAGRLGRRRADPPGRRTARRPALTLRHRGLANTRPTVDSATVRLVVARCQVDYAGRLTAHLPMAQRVLMIKADGSVLVHSDGGSYKPLNWMSPPCSVREGLNDDDQVEWVVTGKDGDTLRILIEDIQHDSSHELGVDPGLQKDGVEKHLQELLAEHPATLADGLTLVRREYPTAIGPVDLMCRDAAGALGGRRDQAPRRDRRRRAADALPRAPQPRAR